MKIDNKISYIQEKILLSVYPGLSILSAREKELKHKQCIVEYKNGSERRYRPYRENIDEERTGFYYEGNIFGLPPTLARVLHCLKNYGIFAYINGSIEIYTEEGYWKTVCQRKLLNDDGTEATLFDQSQKTIDAIFTLLGGDA